MKTDLIARILARQQTLRSVAKQLKEHFVGLDNEIDKIIFSIEAWYCLPEFLTRPTIVCLWGLTGNGKTDLVRRLVTALDMTDFFVELQMTNKGSSQHKCTSLQGLLSSSNVDVDKLGILLLDEIQRFRSVDNEGKDIHDYHFQDLWMLLSDGSFGSAADNKQELIELMLQTAYEEDYSAAYKKTTERDPDDEEEEKIDRKRKFKLTYWSAQELKHKLRLVENVEEIMRWDTSKKIEMIQSRMDGKDIYKPDVYSKLLIFISGNIDEAYSMSQDTDETDVDADVFHKHSLRINLLSIKSALKRRFKPEQIARFGNTHVIYPSLSKSSYKEIIRRKLEVLLDEMADKNQIRFNLDQTVYDAIYRNGVFPAQGTRPVFSTISSFFEAVLPTFTLKCLQHEVSEITLAYEDNHLCAQVGSELVRVRNEGEIDRIKKSKLNKDQIRRVAVHESGHAITYAVLFGKIPTQVSALVAADDKGGFVGLHATDMNSTFMLQQISVMLSGRCAEQLVFGDAYLGGGAAGDIERATTFAANYLRSYGLGTTLSKVVPPENEDAASFNTDLSESNTSIERILRDQIERAHQILSDKIELLKVMANYLIVNENLEPDAFQEMCMAHGLIVENLDAKDVLYPKFHELYDKFLEAT